MPITILTDALWLKLLQLMHHSGIIYNKPMHIMTFGGPLYGMRASCPWRDLE